MTQADILHRTNGIVFTGNKAMVNVWAPFTETVVLRNETTGTDISLTKDDRGYHSSLTEEIQPDDLYRFELDGKQLLPDPASLSQPFGVHESSQAIDLRQFPWTDEAWRNPSLSEYIIYELHVGTFTEAGNFEGIESKLEYLKSLGITAIELMPLAQFPGRRNWGYDGVFPYAVQESYGGAAALQHLVNSCHNAGLAVILDVVYNHLGPEGNYLAAYGPYFTEKYKTPWGMAVNYDDAWCDPVRKFIVENALMWCRDFHIDALRMDAVHAIKDYSPRHIMAEMADALELYNATQTSKRYLIAETDLNDTRFIREKAEGGFGIDGQWCDEFHHALRVTAGQERTGYYSDFTGINDLAASLKNAYVYTGQYSEGRHRNFGTPTNDIPGYRFVVFAQNHDQVGNRALGERLGHLVSADMQRLMATLVFSSPYIPLLFMGEEWAASAPFQYFVDHSDKELLKAIEEGRKREFSFEGDMELPLAHDPATLERSRLNWQEQSAEGHWQMLAFYRSLIALRKSHPVFSNFDRNDLRIAVDQEKKLLIMERYQGPHYIHHFFNFSEEEHSIQLKEASEDNFILLNSAVAGLSGRPLTAESQPHVITLKPESAILISNIYVPS